MFVQLHVKKLWSLKILGSNLTMSILYLKCPLILPALLSQWTAFYHPCCCCYPKQSCCTAQRLDAAGPVLAAANTPQCNSKGWGSNNQCWIHPFSSYTFIQRFIEKGMPCDHLLKWYCLSRQHWEFKESIYHIAASLGPDERTGIFPSIDISTLNPQLRYFKD